MGTEASRDAAEAFCDAAVDILRSRGARSSRTAVAEIVGESQQTFSDATRGHRGSLNRIRAWLERWAGAGLPELELVVTASTVEVRRRSP